ncbi:sacsin N-terminal ATP-binding-like domain-containing protein [Neorhodopirellula lusitana]|nr:hypothetical protein [Neorhodopirellula lusitana]
MKKPPYFVAVRDEASCEWQQLDASPRIAGPWHQLFKQVQSPRHVVSELLQNADDAGATEASANVVDGDFVFTHNGDDFQKEHFASLCRFGYSNKRSLHTIGFRGIGFKSTFSLGDSVQIHTPTLSVVFHRERFTEPHWVDAKPLGQTEIRVTLKDAKRRKHIQSNLEDWIGSPASLLFFKSLRTFRVGDESICWNSIGRGPVKGSEWLATSSEPDSKFLIVRSAEKAFPKEAVEEIRQERMISDEDAATFPPCRVEIVLGMEGELFVVLPTGVKTQLPFACNAPFIQDPNRFRIKEPETSATNQWLLQRAGELAARAMVQWLGRDKSEPEERVKAYGFLPDVDRDDTSIEGACGTVVEEAFAEALTDKPILLTEDQKLVSSDECIAVPPQLLRVWSASQISRHFDSRDRPCLSNYVPSDHLAKLISWNFAKKIDNSQIIRTLTYNDLPRPGSWRKLLSLWAFVVQVRRSTYISDLTQLKIVPVQGKTELCKASKVVRISEKRLLQSDADWEFLSQFLLVLNQNWPRFLSEQQRKADQGSEDDDDTELWDDATTAKGLLETLQLADSSDANKLLEQAAKDAFAAEESEVDDCIRITQIAAKLGATVSEQFSYVTQDSYRRAVSELLVIDIQGGIDEFVPDDWFQEGVVLDEYMNDFQSCSRPEWIEWVESGKSKLRTFVPTEKRFIQLSQRDQVKTFLSERGVSDPPAYQYKTDTFEVTDWDFDSVHWNHWEQQAKSDPMFWAKLARRIMALPTIEISHAMRANIAQVATTGSRKSVTQSQMPPLWAMRLRPKPCLIDTHGEARIPNELLRRSAKTEPLIGVEPFINADDDTEQTRPFLYLFGVSSLPTGPLRLLERLRSVAGVSTLPASEVEKWYSRLDQLFGDCDIKDRECVSESFATQKLILTEDGNWVTSRDVFLNASGDDVPNIPTIRASVKQLQLWHRLGVPERPTADLAIEWLKGRAHSGKVTEDELRRIQAMQTKFPQRVWNECGRWLSLESQCIATKSFNYALKPGSNLDPSHLFKRTKTATADFRSLSADTANEPPFSMLPSLGMLIEERASLDDHSASNAVIKEWLAELGESLSRILLELDEQQERIRLHGSRLARTSVVSTRALQSISCVDGIPVGTPRRVSAIWKDETLYVEERPAAQLFTAVTRELSRAFDLPIVAEAIRASYERPRIFVHEYVNQTFDLQPPEDHSVSSELCSDMPEKVEVDEINSPKPHESNDESEPNSEILPVDNEEERDEVVEPEDASDNGSENESEIAPVPVIHHHPLRPRNTSSNNDQPKPFDLFAKREGFRRTNQQLFTKDDQSWISRDASSVFPWQRFDASGQLQQSYWTDDRCLDEEPIQVEAEAWRLCEQFPEKYSFLLASVDDEFQLLSARDLVAMRKDGHVTLYPATYRIVKEQNPPQSHSNSNNQHDVI